MGLKAKFASIGIVMVLAVLVVMTNAAMGITILGNNTTVTPQQCVKLSHLLQSYERSPQNFTQNIVVNFTASLYHLACGNVTAANTAPLPNSQNQNLTANNLTKTFGNKTDTFNTDANHIREASAQLHNDNVTYGKLVSEDSLLLCIDQVFFHSKAYLNATDLDKYNCDTDTVNDIKEHTFADNQTMLHLAYAYLNARGIK